MDLGKDFRKYALSEGISGMNMHYFEKNLHNSLENSLTPYILEERALNVSVMDVFSRLMRDRMLWVTGVVNENMCDIVQAQLMYLDSVEKKDIKMQLNTQGGSVLHGLGIVDVMDYIGSDVETVNTGLCASMGSILLSSGAKGKRGALNFSRVMIHQVSSGASGHVADNRISHSESEKYNYILFKILAQNSGKDFQEVLDTARRDNWLNSKEALDFGFIDEVFINETKATSITTLMEGYDEYYDKEVRQR